MTGVPESVDLWCETACQCLRFESGQNECFEAKSASFQLNPENTASPMQIFLHAHPSIGYKERHQPKNQTRSLQHIHLSLQENVGFTKVEHSRDIICVSEKYLLHEDY
jgi:hypothetical protein